MQAFAVRFKGWECCMSFATLQLYSVAFSPHKGEVAGLREIFNFCFS